MKMGENSKIEWTDHTFNPWIGCVKVSAGCKNCYAEALDNRWGNDRWGPGSKRERTSESNWRKPLAWNKKARAKGRRDRVFCASMADVFEDHPQLPPWQRDLWKLIEDTPNLDWLILTKRPENVWRMVPTKWTPHKYGSLPDNIWIGTSVEDQETANKRIPRLLEISAAVHFLSVEPLLEQVRLRIPQANYYSNGEINWVIVGGESGPHARPMNPDWARLIRDQCVGAGIPFFFKQWGAWRPYDEKVDPCLHRDSPTRDLEKMHWDYDMYRVGKQAAGRLLDGREWSQFPNELPNLRTTAFDERQGAQMALAF
jgi:protein gp37